MQTLTELLHIVMQLCLKCAPVWAALAEPLSYLSVLRFVGLPTFQFFQDSFFSVFQGEHCFPHRPVSTRSPWHPLLNLLNNLLLEKHFTSERQCAYWYSGCRVIPVYSKRKYLKVTNVLIRCRTSLRTWMYCLLLPLHYMLRRCRSVRPEIRCYLYGPV